jgi:hypothetical protein
MPIIKGCKLGSVASSSGFSKEGGVVIIKETPSDSNGAIHTAHLSILDKCLGCKLCVPVPVVLHIPPETAGTTHGLRPAIVRVVGVVSDQRFIEIIERREEQNRLKLGDFGKINMVNNSIERGRIII